MSITFLPNGHIQAVVLKKGKGDRFFSSSKWQKRYLDIDPETGLLQYFEKPGGAVKGEFAVRDCVVSLPPASIEGAPPACDACCRQLL